MCRAPGRGRASWYVYRARLRMRRYLLVDDNVAFAENVAEIIADTGAEAVVAESGERAMALVAGARFGELVHRIRAVDPGLPAIVVTAYTADDELAAARAEGLLAILPKPVPMARLLE